MSVARAQSDLDAANLALSLIKEPGIGDFNENRTPARAARKWYGTALEETLRKKNWNFATAWTRPAAVAGESVGFLKTRHPLPTDCVKVRFVDGVETDGWAVEVADYLNGAVTVTGKVLVTNVTAPLICYTRLIEDVKLWDGQFLVAFAQRLAELMAPELGRSTSSIEKQREHAKDDLDQAARSDGRERSGQTVSRNTSWARVRGGRGLWRG